MYTNIVKNTNENTKTEREIKMEELDLKELFNIFWNQKMQIILIILIFIVIGIIYTVGFTTPLYSSSTTLVLAKSSDDASKTNTITTSDITINQKLVSTYSEIVKSKNVMRQVQNNLNIDVDEERLKKNVTVSSVKDTELIEITVTNEDANAAAQIANETAKVFTDKVNEIYNMDNVKVVDEAEIAEGPSNINHKKDIIIFAFIGIVVAVIYVIVLNMLDTTIKSVEEVEKLLNLPVIASIPVWGFEKGGKK